MTKLKKIAALMLAIALALTLTACGGTPAPESYDLTAAGVKLDSFTKVVGDRQFVSSSQTEENGLVSSITATYSGVTEAMKDLGVYAQYLQSQGFIDYFGLNDTQMCMALRSGEDDSAVLVSARAKSEQLELRITWQQALALCFGETQYVSGSSLAILPSPELVVFTYPVLGDSIPAMETVNQLILDGVNHMIQYAKDTAAGADYKLMGSYTMSSKLASSTQVTLTGELTMGDVTTTLTSTVTLSDLMGTPVAEYSDITAQ